MGGHVDCFQKWKWSCSVLSDSLRPHGWQPKRLLCPWDFPGKNTGVGCHFLLQEIFPTQGLHPGLPLYRLSHQGSLFQTVKMMISFFKINLFSGQFSCSVVSDSSQPRESQHTRLPCPSQTPGVYPNPCPLSWWCHPAISCVIPFSSCPQSLPASGSFSVSQLFSWSGQSVGVSASATVLPVNTQDWSRLGWTGWISLQSKGLSRVFSNTTVQKNQFFGAQLSSQSNSHIHTWPLEKSSLFN